MDGASTLVVRDKFRQWAASAPQEEQGKGREESPRYRFCIMVDDAALDSVVHLSNDKDAFVNTVSGGWEPYDPLADGEKDAELLEGCTLQDVGWLKVEFFHVMATMCYHLSPGVAWSIQYQ